MFEFVETGIPGCVRLAGLVRTDARGSFVKLFGEASVALFPVMKNLCEVFVSTSEKGVVRGIHFQSPPHDHDKMVSCLWGRALDVVVDLRTSSPTFKRTVSVHLEASSGDMLLVPKGCGHGFQSLEDNTHIIYFTNSAHQSSHDHGVHFQSIGVDWPLPPGPISARDDGLVRLEHFESPFP
ncbi:MAG: dTDP-4-dehydrorhamnose 3,5-epimerase family protein [Planctomycetota bacterium]|nr:dTDP-4-dehydrorhamnose 3,5-epimerase family protein [Planctomycetota bacterium]